MGLLQNDTNDTLAKYTTWRAGDTPTRHAQIGPAEGAGFEPAVPYSGTPLFESGTINHSDTLPPRSISCSHAPRKMRRHLLLLAGIGGLFPQAQGIGVHPIGNVKVFVGQ